MQLSQDLQDSSGSQRGDGDCLEDIDVFVVLDLQLFQDTYWSASVVCV